VGVKNAKYGHGGNRKVGRNRIKCLIYKNENRRIKNKIRKSKKYCRHHLNDKQAKNQLLKLLKMI